MNITNNNNDKAMGKVGLVNLGNTCFLNSVIQSLRYCTDFTNYFLKNEYIPYLHKDRKTTSLVEEIADVFKGMWSTNVRAKASMAPRGFVGSAGRISSESPTFEDLFKGGQSDSSEAVLFILDSIHEALARRVKMEIIGTAISSNDILHINSLKAWSDYYAKGYSPVVENFFGQQMTIVTCSSCNNKSTKFEPLEMIKTPMDTSTNNQPLSTCIDKAFDKEILEEYQCDKCNTRGKATLEHTISKLPPTLIISLKRFDNNNNKLNTKIEVDLDKTDLAKWISFPAVAKNISTEYSVFAVIEQQGGTRGGHYVSYTKHNGTWVCYDDNSICEVSPTNVINKDTYILFMTRKEYVTPTPIEPAPKVDNAEEA
jgi:ubiquitin carboxyl-terminal hydrolase 8